MANTVLAESGSFRSVNFADDTNYWISVHQCILIIKQDLIDVTSEAETHPAVDPTTFNVAGGATSGPILIHAGMRYYYGQFNGWVGGDVAGSDFKSPKLAEMDAGILKLNIENGQSISGTALISKKEITLSYAGRDRFVVPIKCDFHYTGDVDITTEAV